VRPHGHYGHCVPRVTTDKPTGKTISMPLVATTFYRDNEHNNQIEIDYLGGKRVLDNTRRGDDGQHKASGATGGQPEASDARQSG
jgi:hypothetical protein